MFPYVHMFLRVYVPSCIMYVPPCVCPFCIYVPSVCVSPACVYPFMFSSIWMSLRLCVSLSVFPLRVSLQIKSVALSGLSLAERSENFQVLIGLLLIYISTNMYNAHTVLIVGSDA